MGKRRQSENRGNEILRSGIEYLKKGCRAAEWVCREFLNLGGQPMASDVVNAVHAHIHASKRFEPQEGHEYAIAAITAGAVLLRGIEGKR